MLEVDNLTKSFGGLKAVNRCSFSVQKGQITGLIGPNGAGKTTVFNLITGFDRPDGGKVLFKGDEITSLPPHLVFRKKICRTFQIPREFGEITVLENMMLVPADQAGDRIWNSFIRPGLVRRQEASIREKALETLKFLDLLNLRDEYAKSLSGGQKKLLELGRTMMADPEFVLLDEPGAGVNPSLMKRLAKVVQELCYERGITFFLIEHDMDLVMNLCNPIIVMSQGSKLMEGSPEQVRRDERVLEAYLGGQYGGTEG
jgi:branched-chain amino acid transport system ATP-binding protein